ncbi:outer membrane protein transport protein [Joostella atrarenae]|uniref:Outer membrane protein transport protein n=1 Tax=Joostella atrarenae TaxID=679257 RepID=A0ABS9J682_9FLAO|nr:outer membrane protein transport protein [Joostella atrarenae]MCF8715932.1 outer membrane protein transport protein [Joostella atrarenae]
MRNLFLFLVTFIFATNVFAQNRNDVALYGSDKLNGTARYQGMSGAFGALGGDMSSLNINPAGSAVFTNTVFTISLANYHINNETNYFNGRSETDFSQLKLNQIGGALVFENGNSSSPWKKFTMAFNYELSNNFENEFLATGDGNTSIAQYFLNNATGYRVEDLKIQDNENYNSAYLNIGHDLGYSAQQGYLGYQNLIIDPATTENPDETSYVSNAKYASRIGQDQLVITSGYDSKYTLNFASQYTDNVYLGFGLNFHSLERRRISQFKEFGYDSDSKLQYVEFDNDLYTYGNGFSFNIGGIAKLSNMVRVGASYQSPTWYGMTDELSQNIYTEYIEGTEIIGLGDDLRSTIIFPNYDIYIPGKYTGSMAVIFGPFGLLSLDYSYQDMSNAKLKPTTDPVFAEENQAIDNEFQAVSTVRVGGEFRVKRFSFRGGYRFEGSPYEDEFTSSDLNGYSLGLGYSFGATKLDLGFSQAFHDYNISLYDTGLTSTAAIDNKNTNVSFSVTFNL